MVLELLLFIGQGLRLLIIVGDFFVDIVKAVWVALGNHDFGARQQGCFLMGSMLCKY